MEETGKQRTAQDAEKTLSQFIKKQLDTLTVPDVEISWVDRRGGAARRRIDRMIVHYRGKAVLCHGQCGRTDPARHQGHTERTGPVYRCQGVV